MNASAVIVARFQTPCLHAGHRYLIEAVGARHRKVIVLLGVSPVKGSRRNPFDFFTRERMLKSAYPSLVLLPLADHPSDEAWSRGLDALLGSTFPGEEFLLYGSRDSFLPYYSGLLPVTELPVQGTHSATGLRQELADEVRDSEDFRCGVNYACQNRYVHVYPTVDMALFKDDRRYLLLGRKAGATHWRLPGGFADAADASFEAAARRELEEECGPVETGVLHYIGSARIDDWRYRREADKILTLLFATDLVWGEPAAADDLEEVAWFAVADLSRCCAAGSISPEHVPLIDQLLAYLGGAVTQSLTNNISI